MISVEINKIFYALYFMKKYKNVSLKKFKTSFKNTKNQSNKRKVVIK